MKKQEKKKPIDTERLKIQGVSSSIRLKIVNG